MTGEEIIPFRKRASEVWIVGDRLRKFFSLLRHHPIQVLIVVLAVGAGSVWAGRWWWGNRRFEAARQALEAGDLGQAQEHLEHCLQLWSDRAEVHLLAAQVARRAGACDRAEHHLDECERHQGPNRGSTTERALLRAQQGDLAGIEKSLRALVSRGDPDSPLILEALAQGFMYTYRWSEAMECLEMLLQRMPGHARALLWQGQVYRKLGRDELALEAFRKASDQAPEALEPRLELADTLDHLGRVPEAVDQYERLRQRQPHPPEVLLGLARCRYDLRQPAEARQLLDHLLAENPDQGAALLLRGRLDLHDGQAARAEESLRRSVELAPHDPDALGALHLCLNAQGKSAEDRLCLEQLQRVDKQRGHASRLMLQAGESPRDMALRYQAGMALMNTGREEEALHWLFSALQGGPTDRPVHAALADYFERTGQLSLAAWHRRS